GVYKKRLLPAEHAQAPAVTRLQASEPELGPRRCQVVASGRTERQERFSHHRANRVTSDVFRRGVATTVAEESRHRFVGTETKRAPENIAARPATGPAAAFVERHRTSTLIC